MENNTSTPELVPQEEQMLEQERELDHYRHILGSLTNFVIALLLAIASGIYFVVRTINLLQSISTLTSLGTNATIALIFQIFTLVIALGVLAVSILGAMSSFKLRRAVSEEKTETTLIKLARDNDFWGLFAFIAPMSLFIVELVMFIVVALTGDSALNQVMPSLAWIILIIAVVIFGYAFASIARKNLKANLVGKDYYLALPVQSISKLEFFFIGLGNSAISIGLFLYNFVMIFVKAFIGIFLGAYKIAIKTYFGVIAFAKKFYHTFFDNSYRTKLSYLFMGVGHAFMARPFKTIMYLAIQAGYFVYMFLPRGGFYWLSKFDNLGDNAVTYEWVCQIPGFTLETCPESALVQTQAIFEDNSMLITLFSVATILLSLAFVVLYWLSIRGVAKAEEKYTPALEAYKHELAEYDFNSIETTKDGAEYLDTLEGKEDEQVYTRPRFRNPLPTLVDELKELLNGRFHISTLSIPTITISVFTVLPLIFMILLAFTNYNQNNGPPNSLFTWVGLQTFAQLFTSVGGSSFSKAFADILQWTFIWAFFATFSNYIFGLILAMIINRKGIKLKKLWRTVFVITIAVPQFVTLLLMSRLLDKYGPINQTLIELGWITKHIEFLSRPLNAKISVILVNVWVGVPYTMLITSGILMNIPGDLYESARIDGANPFTQFTKITLPYMLFVTGPYLITQFIGNINNFNVIFFLTGGGPSASLPGVQYGKTDILVTWLYNLTVGGAQQQYSIGSALGIFIFLISVFITLSLYSKTSAATQEGDFA